MVRDQFILDIQHELIVDNFASGGGASCGISSPWINSILNDLQLRTLA